MRRLRALLVKEFIQMVRDRITFAIMVMIPVVQLLVFGFAINTDVKHLRTMVFDQSRSAESREMLASFEGTGYFDIAAYADSFAQIDQALQEGRCSVGIVFPPDYAKEIASGRTATMQVLVDASDSMSSSSAISAAQLLGSAKERELIEKKGMAPLKLIDVRIRAWYNPDFVSPYYMVPGTLCVILLMTMVMLTAVAIVREREQGTLEQLIVTPLKTWELMLGKILPYVLVGYMQLGIGLAIGSFVFGVPMRGSVVLLFALALLFIVANLALGILLSSVSKTQMQAMQMSFFVMLPNILLSGFMFPREAMPNLFFQISRVLPLTYFLRIARGITLKGVGLAELSPEVWALCILIVLFSGISLVKFHKTLD